MTSFGYTHAVFQLTRNSMMLTARWKVAEALFNPEGIRMKLKRPDWDVKGRFISVGFGNFDVPIPVITVQRNKYGWVTK